MDIDLLKTFIEVCQTQHFGKAADNLFITQSAVSARIRLLETQLACQLFQRNHKRVSLSDEGKLFLEHAQKILNQWQLAKTELEQAHEAPKTFKLASPHTLWQLGLSSISQHLNSPFQLDSFSYNLFPQFLAQHDGYIVSSPHPLLQQYEKRKLGELELVAFTAHEYARASNRSYIHLPWGSTFENFVKKHAFKQQPYNQTDQINIALQMLQRQATFVYLPKSFHVQFDNITILQSYKTITLPIALYSADTNNKKERDAIFKQVQHALLFANNNKR